MIRSFRHRGLRRLYEQDDGRRLRSDHLAKIRRILARLDEIDDVSGMDLPGFRLHPLKGELRGFWSVAVSGNWRIIFRVDGADVFDVDLLDYH